MFSQSLVAVPEAMGCSIDDLFERLFFGMKKRTGEKSMKYSDLLSVLKRFSFEEKMRMAQNCSRRTLTPNGVVDVDVLRVIPSPWELETFVLLAIKAKEWKYDSFRGKNSNKFTSIINCIRNENSPFMDRIDAESLLTWLLAVTASVQFEIQEYFPFKMFRFNYFFSFVNDKVDMPKIFKEKFACRYYEYSLLGHLLWLTFAAKDFSQELFTAIIKHFNVSVSNLILSRQAYIESLDKITTDPVNYLYCLRPSYSYPFVEYNGFVYCPLPHLLRRATTSSLMHRLTDGNAELMALVGKEVYEDYLYTIVSESGIFDEVIPEKKYTFRRAERRTADLMARRGNDFVFFDSKSFTPKIAIRTFSQMALDQDVKRLAESCAQVYRHIRQRFPNEYCYFEHSPETPVQNIFGIVVLQENPYIRGDAIYRKAAEILKIDEDSDEFVWMYTHVGMTSIYSIERFCFSGTEVCTSLHKTCEEKKITHAWLSDNTNTEISYKRYTDFMEQVKQDMVRILEGLKKSN